MCAPCFVSLSFLGCGLLLALRLGLLVVASPSPVLLLLGCAFLVAVGGSVAFVASLRSAVLVSLLGLSLLALWLLLTAVVAPFVGVVLFCASLLALLFTASVLGLLVAHGLLLSLGLLLAFGLSVFACVAAVALFVGFV